MPSPSNTISGRSAFLAVLKDEGVTHLFGNPGTTELPIMHALTEQSDLGYVLGLQESVVVAMADGYARASGKLAACNVHVAPGLGNAIGALYTASQSGSPIIVTAGQQEQGHGLTEPLLYAPLTPIAEPVVKWAVEVARIEDLPRILRRAAKVATTPPTGPVFISLPGDILNRHEAIDLGQATRVDSRVRPSDVTLAAMADRIAAAANPVVLAGHETATGGALDAAARFADLLGAPVYQQSVPQGAHFLSEHPCFMGALTRSQPQVRQVLAPYDLIVSLGADFLRMSVWSETEPLPEHMAVVQIGLRDWELAKNYSAEIAALGDVQETLAALNPLLEERLGESRRGRIAALGKRNWSANRNKAREALADVPETVGLIPPAWLCKCLAEELPEDGIVVDEGITTGARLLDFLPFRDANGYFGNVSGGIGWGIAAAVGVQIAQPERRTVALIGDGSAMYSIQALWTAANARLPVIFVIANNGGYRILKDRMKAFHDNDAPIGMDFRDPPIDATRLAEGFGMAAVRAETPAAFRKAYRDAFAGSGPVVIEAMVSADG